LCADAFFLQISFQIEGDNEPQPSIPREEGQVPFVFVGTVDSIGNAKVLLEYHLVHLKVRTPFIILHQFTNSTCFEQEVEQLRQEKLEIDQQLRAIQGSTMGSMQNFPMSRRSERAYSSEIEGSSRGGRGMRGRGRGSAGGGRGMRSRYSSKSLIHHIEYLMYVLIYGGCCFVSGNRRDTDEEYTARNNYSDSRPSRGNRGGRLVFIGQM
jgi:fragile X mental retardation protein